MLGAVRWELGSITPKITASVTVLSGWKYMIGTKHWDIRKLNVEKTTIHAPVQTGWMWGYNYSVPSKLQQFICLHSLVAWVCLFPSRVGGLRGFCVQCGRKEWARSKVPGVCWEWIWGSRSVKLSTDFSCGL